MKKMKKIVALCLVLVMGMAFASTAVYARGRHGAWRQPHTNTQHHATQLFTADGFEVNWQGGFRQQQDGDWTFGRGCWYVDADGNVVNVWGMRMYDAYGNPASGNFGGWNNGSCWRFENGLCWRWQ